MLNSKFILALAVGTVGSFLIACSSVYVALRLGALPWAILFAVVLSYTVLRTFFKTNLSLVNVAHTTMSAGSMVAGSVAFVVPAFWRMGLEQTITPLSLALVILIGIVVALVLSYHLRVFLLDKIKLNYPIGTLAYNTIVACNSGGQSSFLVWIFLVVMVVFTIGRDHFHIIQTTIVLPVLGSIFISPMAASMGYVLGYNFAIFWGISAIIVAFIKTYSSINLIVISDFSLGMMLGSGLGFLILMLFKQRQIIGNFIKIFLNRVLRHRLFLIIFIICLSSLFIYVKNSQLLVLFMLMLVIVAVLASLLVGQGGINPFEVLGVISVLALVIVFNIDKTWALLGILLATTTCALTGDMMNDYKAGDLLKTNPKAMLVGEAVGALVGLVGALATLFFMFNHSNGILDTTLYPAPQSMAIATFLQKDYSMALLVGFILAMLISLTNKIPMLAVALGAYVGSSMGIMVLVGGVLALISYKHQTKGRLVSAGILAGEGFTSTILALYSMTNF